MRQITISVPDDQESMRDELIRRLKAGPVTFVYKKKSTDEMRYAHGTLNDNLFIYDFKGSKRKQPTDQIVYWDIDKGEWRSLKDYNLIKILEDE